ncbi:hypothetical protein AaE_009969 [Aphanomyces astaci]|uniref:PX domain-containing protein n=1 Tax=Aphanomyces astaci TaxID=112090 RepID=A0A6A5AAY0_APHAT|nr:hypothetical protein AaE_009969 [Aphanomyces astaci]
MGCNQSFPGAKGPDPASIQWSNNAVSNVPDMAEVKQRVDVKERGRPFINDYSVDVNGIVIYHIEANGGGVVNKRFTDFKVFHACLQRVFPLIPPLPSSGILTALKRSDPALIQDRRARFDDILSVAPPDHVAAFLAIPSSISKHWIPTRICDKMAATTEKTA